MIAETAGGGGIGGIRSTGSNAGGVMPRPPPEFPSDACVPFFAGSSRLARGDDSPADAFSLASTGVSSWRFFRFSTERLGLRRFGDRDRDFDRDFFLERLWRFGDRDRDFDRDFFLERLWRFGDRDGLLLFLGGGSSDDELDDDVPDGIDVSDDDDELDEEPEEVLLRVFLSFFLEYFFFFFLRIGDLLTPVLGIKKTT
jgi:hypothetical protein